MMTKSAKDLRKLLPGWKIPVSCDVYFEPRCSLFAGSEGGVGGFQNENLHEFYHLSASLRATKLEALKTFS
jgi:hypothetical protein